MAANKTITNVIIIMAITTPSMCICVLVCVCVIGHLHWASEAIPCKPAWVENWNSDSLPEGTKNTTHDLWCHRGVDGGEGEREGERGERDTGEV